MLLAALILWAVVLWRGLLQPAPPRSVAGMCAAGALLMLSWFFTALLEPLLTHRRINAQEVFFSLVTVAGIALIFHFDTRYRLGILFGLATGLTSALLSISFRGFRARCGTMTILSWELVGALLCALVLLAPYRALMPPSPSFPLLKTSRCCLSLRASARWACTTCRCRRLKRSPPLPST